jgi:hypothetical protein
MAIRVVAVVFVFFSEMSNGHIVAPMKAFTVFFATLRWNRWLTKFPFPFHIYGTLLGDIPASCFDAVVEASALNIAELLGWRIPWTTVMVGWRAGLRHGLASQDLLGMSEGEIVTPSKSIPIVVAEAWLN